MDLAAFKPSTTHEVEMANTGTVQAGTSTWHMDSVHSSIEFSVKHMMMTTVRGRFKEANATLTGNEEHPDQGNVEVAIDAGTIDTGAPDRDTHLRSADFLDVENHPKITFRSKRVNGSFRSEGDEFELIGDLTIRGSAMEVTLDCVFEGRGKDPWGKERVGFSAKGEIDRREWGLKWNQAIETGGILVANKVRIEAEVQFVRDEG